MSRPRELAGMTRRDGSLDFVLDRSSRTSSMAFKSHGSILHEIDLENTPFSSLRLTCGSENLGSKCPESRAHGRL